MLGEFFIHYDFEETPPAMCVDENALALLVLGCVFSGTKTKENG